MPNRHDVDVDGLAVAIVKVMDCQKRTVGPADVAVLAAQALLLAFTTKATWTAFRHSAIYRLQVLEAAGRVKAMVAKHNKKRGCNIKGVCGHASSAGTTS